MFGIVEFMSLERIAGLRRTDTGHHVIEISLHFLNPDQHVLYVLLCSADAINLYILEFYPKARYVCRLRLRTSCST